jgi:ribose/xylose/arabinose/galactoside ABC-type transport system permease subunit
VRIPPIITTLATLFAYDGLALVLTGGINIDLTQSPAAFLAIGQGQVSGIPFQLLFLYLPMLAAFIYAQHGTRFGRELYLAGSSTLAANLAGLRVDRLRGATYVVAGLVSGIAGIVDAASARRGRMRRRTPTSSALRSWCSAAPGFSAGPAR